MSSRHAKIDININKYKQYPDGPPGNILAVLKISDSFNPPGGEKGQDMTKTSHLINFQEEGQLGHDLGKRGGFRDD